MNNVFEIDLNRVTLKGYQRISFDEDDRGIPFVSDKVIDYMVSKIEDGIEFDPVIVDYWDESTYNISFFYDNELKMHDGGHHRAVAHYIVGKRLPCRLISHEDFQKSYMVKMSEFYPISQAVLIDDDLLKPHGAALEDHLSTWRKQGFDC